MIEKHQQTNGIGRGKITINPEYIKRAREITVGGLPVKILSSNPNTGRVLAQFPDGHTEEVKAAPDYFIGGNTSTKELKNNLPIYGETNTAANERADSLDEAHDLTPIFSNLITAGQISTMNEGALDLLNGKYLEGTTKLLSPAMFGSGIGGIAARSGIGGYNLFNKNGVRKTYNLFNLGHYGEGALSLLGDAFNTAMATEGLGSISNALKGTSGYRNWRLANAINKGVKENAVITAYNRNPVAKDIGNLWDYQSYLDNVFPNSKVKYVLWHGSRSKNLETFNTNMIGSHMPIKNSVGMYLTPERNIAVGYGTRGSVYPVLLNTENPFITNQFFGGISKNGVNVTKISPKVRRTLLANNDAVIAPRRGEIAFFDPDNALILGSNRDMLGFQKFMKSSPEKRIPHQPQLQYLKEPSTSLKFFERPQSKISEAERLGVPKGDRNFKPKWHVANYPGYLLKGLMKGSLLERLLSKNGTININLLNAYFNKASQIEREVANKVLTEQFAGLKTIDYNLFKKAVLDELIGAYNRVPLTKYADYGINRLGINVTRMPDGAGGIIEHLPGTNTFTFTFESPRISIGNGKHYDTTTLGHSRTYTLPEDPHTLHVMESQSDWGLAKLTAPYTGTTKYLNDPTSYRRFIDGHKRLLAEMLKNPSDYLEGAIERQIANIEHHEAVLKLILGQERLNSLVKYLHDNYLLRQLQENLKYAAENRYTKMRYPTSETAAKIEGYQPIKQQHTPKGRSLLDALNKSLLTNEKIIVGLGDLLKPNYFDTYGIELSKETKDLLLLYRKEKLINDYSPEHQTILKKYANFPKLFLKLFKDLKVRTVTDAKGNTWYEVDVPKGYLSREWLFKRGGKMNMLEFLKNGSGIHIKKKNRGKFTKYCHGKVTDECIRKAKASGNPTLVKRATFAANARKWKHKGGGKAFVNGVNVLDSNPKMYKYNKKYKMAQEGAKLTFWLLAGDWIKDNLNSISTIGNGISNLISAKNRLDEINLFALAKQKELKAFKYKTWKDKYLSNLQNQTDRSDIVNAHNAFNLTNINDALQEKLNEINSLIANLLYLNDLQDTGLGDITSGLLGIATNILLGTTKKKKIDNTFSPLANQTMSQIRGKLLDINANFSE